MKRSELMAVVAKETGLTVKQVDSVLDSVESTIQQNAIKGVDTVTGFVTIKVKRNEAKSGKNPLTGGNYNSPAHLSVTASPSKAMKDKIKAATIER